MIRRNSQRAALTLMEVLVVIGIVGALIGLAIPAVFKARNSARLLACQNNLKQIGEALANYESAHGRLPAGSQRLNTAFGTSTTWAVSLLPFLEQEDLYRRVLDSGTANGEPATASVVPVYQCPADGFGGKVRTTALGTFSLSNYLGFFGQFTQGVDHQGTSPFAPDFGASYRDFTDGLSNTLVVGEYLTGLPQHVAGNDLRGVFWLDRPGSSQIYTFQQPNSPSPDMMLTGTCFSDPDRNLPCADIQNNDLTGAGARSQHRGGVNVLLGDGRVQFVQEDIHPQIWTALSTTQGGEVVDAAEAAAGTAEVPQKRRPFVPFIRDKYMVVLKGPANPAAFEGLGIQIQQHYQHALTGFSAHIPKDKLDLVKNHPAVRFVTQDRVATICAQTIPTGVRRMQANISSTLPGDGRGPGVDATVVVIDTGIDFNHPDLYVIDTRGFGYSSGFDDNGHGTHVSGTIGAVDNDFGVVGVAEGVRLVGLKVLSAAGSGSFADILAALDYVAQNASQFDVVNMSLGGSGSDPAMDLAIAQITNQGVIVVVAAGNDSTPASDFTPANSPTVICVGALCDTDGLPGGLGSPGSFGDPDDTFASFSNYGAKVDVIAPGEDILSTWPGNSYQSISGTSMASPHVAGMVALMLNHTGQFDGQAPGNGVRNITIAPVNSPSRSGNRPTPEAFKLLLKQSAKEMIPGLSANSDPLLYYLVNASGY